MDSWNSLIPMCKSALLLLLRTYHSDKIYVSYVQFSPLAYITKLYIELQMASLIFKVVRSRGNGSVTERDGPCNSYKNEKDGSSKGLTNSRLGGTFSNKATNKESPNHECEGMVSESEFATWPEPYSITKTIETSVVVSDQEEGKPDIGHRAW